MQVYKAISNSKTYITMTTGTPFEDTKCKPCVEGETFSNTTACVQCSVCNVTLSNCSVTNDTVCSNSEDVAEEKDGIVSTFCLFCIFVLYSASLLVFLSVSIWRVLF